ncbi:MAG: hypothetical protein ACWA5Q_01840 [bacterium]
MRILPKKIRAVINAPKERRQKEQEYRAALDVDISGMRTVCLALGPYRNLTTLTASILFLHPNCQVLNHGASRILGDDRLDFLDQYSQEKFDNFVRYAIYISAGGGRGKQGGSILHSHAFDPQHPMGALYRKRYGEALTKPDIQSVFWKESLRTDLHIRDHQIDLGKIFAANPKLRFLLPVRNPIDCALSNKRTGHLKIFGLQKEASVTEVLDKILDEFQWEQQLKASFPDRFFEYFEHDFTTDVARSLAEFLEIEPLQTWLEDVVEAFAIQKPYQHEEELVNHYRQAVEQRFEAYPDFKAKLLAFV